MDWLGKMIGLLSEFLYSNKEIKGGGVIQVCYCLFVVFVYVRMQFFVWIKCFYYGRGDRFEG